MRRTPAFTIQTAPVAVLGTIALTLTATPAGAASPTTVDREPLRAMPQPAAAPTAVAVPAAKRATAKTHTVVRGDTISAIAAKNGLRTADVLAWNGLGWKSIIHPGDVIRLSAAGSSDSGDQKAQAKQSGTAKTSTKKSPGKSPGKSQGSTATGYTVKKGDTLWAIARSQGVSLKTLLRANDLTGASIIYPGQKLALPGAVAASAKKTSAPKKSAPATAVAPKTTLDAEQRANAKVIISVGRERGVPDRGIAIALATAMVESWIRNLDYGTHDSLGLFQQRPSTGWGTPDQVRDPRRAAAAFFGGPDDPNGTDTRGLLDIPGWQEMGFGAAAQAVQRSAYPERYGPWEAQAHAWLAALD